MVRQTGLLILGIILISLPACALTQARGLTSTPPPPQTEYTSYIVQPGDTLGQIAMRFHVTIEQIIDMNAQTYPVLARDPSQLRSGWRLVVPNPVAAARASATAEAASVSFDLSQAARLIVEGINSARAQHGLVLLRADIVLTRISGDRSTDMISRDYFSHYDPSTGQEPLIRNLQASKFSYQYAGENIAEIKNDAGWVPPPLTVVSRYSVSDLANEFVKGWLNSTEHRANILNSHYRRTGVAVAVSRDGHRIVATQVFSD